MSDDGIVIFGVVMIIFGAILTSFFIMYLERDSIYIEKSQWNCTQSRILDPQNVDKIECINYRKKENDIGRESKNYRKTSTI